MGVAAWPNRRVAPGRLTGIPTRWRRLVVKMDTILASHTLEWCPGALAPGLRARAPSCARPRAPLLPAGNATGC